ncbi:MAG: hypothetical protein AAGI68_10885 [Planctomycetota bacterium]
MKLQPKPDNVTLILLLCSVSLVVGAVLNELSRPRAVLLNDEQYVDMAIEELEERGFDLSDYNKSDISLIDGHIAVSIYKSLPDGYPDGGVGGIGVLFDLSGQTVSAGIIP